MNFKQLEQFMKVAKVGSITKAAEDLYISQPALSRTISSLEEELGFQLFTRTAQGISLTKAGGAFLVGVTDSLGILSKTISHAQVIAEANMTDLTVTFSFEDFDNEILTRLQEKVGPVRIHFIQLPPDQAYRELLAGKTDFAIVPSMQPHADIQTELLMAEEVLVAAQPGHRLYGMDKASKDAMNGESIACNELSFSMETIERISAQYGISMNFDFISTDRQQVERFAARYGSLVFVPISELVSAKSRQPCWASEGAPAQFIRIEPQIFTRTVNLAWSKGRVFSVIDRELMALLRGDYDKRGESVKNYLAATLNGDG